MTAFDWVLGYFFCVCEFMLMPPTTLAMRRCMFETALFHRCCNAHLASLLPPARHLQGGRTGCRGLKQQQRKAMQKAAEGRQRCHRQPGSRWRPSRVTSSAPAHREASFKPGVLIMLECEKYALAAHSCCAQITTLTTRLASCAVCPTPLRCMRHHAPPASQGVRVRVGRWLVGA